MKSQRLAALADPAGDGVATTVFIGTWPAHASIL
jgi:hypothetical protein